MNTTPCTPSTVADDSGAIDTCTLDTRETSAGGGVRAVLARTAAFRPLTGGRRPAPGARTETTGPEPAGWPAHTGKLPAWADPAVGLACMFPAFLRAAAAAAAPAVNAAVPDRAAGHDAGSRCDSGIRGIFTVRLATAWTWTGRCAATAGGLTGPGTPAAESSPTARDIVASIDTDGTIRRRR